MKIVNTKFQGLKIIKGINYYDNRGYFRETFKNSFFQNKKFIFLCMSKSKTYGKKYSIILSESNSTSLFIPAGFAHGFCALANENLVFYGCTNYRSKNNEVGILWNDSELKIKWPIKNPIISQKDRKLRTFYDFKKFYEGF